MWIQIRLLSQEQSDLGQHWLTFTLKSRFLFPFWTISVVKKKKKTAGKWLFKDWEICFFLRSLATRPSHTSSWCWLETMDEMCCLVSSYSCKQKLSKTIISFIGKHDRSTILFINSLKGGKRATIVRLLSEYNISPEKDCLARPLWSTIHLLKSVTLQQCWTPAMVPRTAIDAPRLL